MNIGIILYSQTGNTRSVAEMLKGKLAAKGHTASIEEITVDGDVKPGPIPVTLKYAPDAAKYDAVVLAAPVQAFSLCQPMKAYLPKLVNLVGKKSACFVTKHLGNNWTGGNGAIKAMKKALEAAGAACGGGEIILWSAKDREAKITEAVERLAALF